MSRAGRRRLASALAVMVSVAVSFTVIAVAIVAAIPAEANHPGGRPLTVEAPTSTVPPATAATTATTSPPTPPAATTTTDLHPAGLVLPAENLKIDDTVARQLMEAGAGLNGRPASDYTGLQPGETYYAYDPATATWWAGTALVPSRASLRARVSTQDSGSYLIFWRTTGHAWTAQAVGMSGAASGCQSPVPASVAAVWHWSPGACRPASR